MARCCGGATCGCTIADGPNTIVTGIGTVDDPYRIESTSGETPGVELASAEVMYSFGTTFAISPATAAAVIGAMIIVPPTIGPVLLQWGGDAAVGTSGKALLQLQVWQGVGSFTVPLWTSAPLTSEMATNFSGNGIPLRGTKRLDPSAVDRTYFLAAIMFRDAASSPTGSMKNIPENPSYLRATAL